MKEKDKKKMSEKLSVRNRGKKTKSVKRQRRKKYQKVNQSFLPLTDTNPNRYTRSIN